MQIRSLVVLGFGASLSICMSAFAAPMLPHAQVQGTLTPTETVHVVQVASKAEKETIKKKGTAVSKTQSKAKISQPKAAEKQAASAKAKAEKAKELKAAKAERAKKLAAEKAERAKKIAAAKAEKEKKAAAAKIEREKKKAAAAKAAEERKARLAKQAETRRVAREKAAEQRRHLAETKAKAAEERRLARVRAEEERQKQVAVAAEAVRQAEAARLVSMEVVQKGNNGELRSESAVQLAPKNNGLFAGLFGGQQVQKQSMLPETRALDAAMEQRAAKKPFKVAPEYMPAVVDFSGYKPGTIVIDTAARRLYLVERTGKARRYAIAVGKEGLQYKGTVKVADKQEWPRWIPTREMQQREPKKYGQYADGMPGGGANPLGARAIYLHQNGRDTYLRIHGTTAPETIGTNSSNGCFRMINEHVIDLYRRVPVGTEVVVL